MLVEEILQLPLQAVDNTNFVPISIGVVIIMSVIISLTMAFVFGNQPTFQPPLPLVPPVFLLMTPYSFPPVVGPIPFIPAPPPRYR